MSEKVVKGVLEALGKSSELTMFELARQFAKETIDEFPDLLPCDNPAPFAENRSGYIGGLIDTDTLDKYITIILPELKDKQIQINLKSILHAWNLAKEFANDSGNLPGLIKGYYGIIKGDKTTCFPFSDLKDFICPYIQRGDTTIEQSGGENTHRYCWLLYRTKTEYRKIKRDKPQYHYFYEEDIHFEKKSYYVLEKKNEKLKCLLSNFEVIGSIRII